jgi:hypothetical protein
MMSAPAPILLYAELLANIRQISVIASLQIPSTTETSAELLNDRSVLSLSHQGETVLLSLPDQVSAPAILQKPVVGRTEISWRLPLASQQPSRVATDFGDTAIAPWSSVRLSGLSKICCRNCDTVLCKGESIQVWKDLPSANWAEMMDFWHCHKPTDHQKSTDNSVTDDLQSKKGYGANNKFMAETGVGFVDLTYLLLAQKDCQQIRVSGILFRFFGVLRFRSRASRRRPSLQLTCSQWPGHRYKSPRVIYARESIDHFYPAFSGDHGLLDRFESNPPQAYASSPSRRMREPYKEEHFQQIFIYPHSHLILNAQLLVQTDLFTSAGDH